MLLGTLIFLNDSKSMSSEMEDGFFETGFESGFFERETIYSQFEASYLSCLYFVVSSVEIPAKEAIVKSGFSFELFLALYGLIGTLYEAVKSISSSSSCSDVDGSVDPYLFILKTSFSVFPSS
ncbi:hypothetical protein WICMUC_005827 [Wickerhamomyces mucosus]|uniref:Uncharacterized protein n=1 Tax=Wickerhamomyces mucosus TaxID=1378264 RepID=A0A9P8P3C9_9ASCO|nr:hypothetical protein WICMUC_005827 [Wickerhamomyces mucosus]